MMTAQFQRSTTNDLVISMVICVDADESSVNTFSSSIHQMLEDINKADDDDDLDGDICECVLLVGRRRGFIMFGIRLLDGYGKFYGTYPRYS